MIYVVVGTKDLCRTMLVKAVDVSELKQRLELTSDERIVGSFTDREIEALTTSQFTVVTGCYVEKRNGEG